MSRQKREPYIFRRPGRQGYYAFVDRVNKNVALGTDDEKEAIEALAKLLTNRRSQEIYQESKNFAEVIKETLKRSKVNNTPQTYQNFEYDILRICRWLEDKKNFYAHDISKGLIEEYKADRIKTVSPARINRELNNWKKVYKVAVEWQCCHADVLTFFVKLREPKPQPHMVGLMKEEIDAFLNHVYDLRYKALFRTVIGTAIRDDEARHLEASDIQDPYIVVTPKPPGACVCCPKGWTSKSYRYREIPISDGTLEAARFFTKEKAGMNLDKRKIARVLQDARQKAGVKHFTLHDFRRAWASHMLSSGFKLEHISRWLGHADVVTTMRYLRIIEICTPSKESLPF